MMCLTFFDQFLLGLCWFMMVENTVSMEYSTILNQQQLGWCTIYILPNKLERQPTLEPRNTAAGLQSWVHGLNFSINEIIIVKLGLCNARLGVFWGTHHEPTIESRFYDHFHKEKHHKTARFCGPLYSNKAMYHRGWISPKSIYIYIYVYIYMGWNIYARSRFPRTCNTVVWWWSS